MILPSKEAAETNNLSILYYEEVLISYADIKLC